MCKFHILNCCSRGDKCQFAHDKEQMQNLPDLFRTKLCRLLINTGVCEDKECRYAHSKEELRVVPGFGHGGPGQETVQATESQWQQAMHQETNGRPQLPVRAQSAAHKQPGLAPQANFDNFDTYQAQSLDMQMALLQMGQAAQAHAVEAMRLQAMAVSLQKGGGLPAGAALALPQGAVGFPAQGVQGMTMPGVMMGLPMQFSGQAQDSDAVPARRRPSRTASGSSLAQMAAKVNEVDERPPATDMPSKVNLGSLRSMSSSGSLPIDMLQDGPEPLPGDMPDSNGGWRVKNTFLDFDTGQSTPTLNRLRPICSAAGRLDALAEASGEAPPQAPSPRSPDGAGRDVYVRQAGTRPMSRNVSFQSGTGLLSRSSSFQLEEAPGGTAKAALGGEAPGEPWKRWAAQPLDGSSNLTVKNTFLDFGPEEPRVKLRAVHTAAGRLCDYLGQE